MTPAHPAPRPHGRRRQETRARIVSAAADLFLDRGYVATSMAAIADAADVSKRTLYLHFSAKQELFVAAIEETRRLADAEQALDDALFTSPERVAADLVTFGATHLRAIQYPRLRAFRWLVMWEVADHPTLLGDALRGAPARVATWFAGRLRALVAAGVLDIDDPDRAAEEFLTLLTSQAQQRSACWTRHLDRTKRERIAEATATFFLRAYGPRPASASSASLLRRRTGGRSRAAARR